MKTAINMFKALSDENRVRTVGVLLEQKELCACQITELLEITSATVSRHMKILSDAGIINSRKDGRWVYYSVNIDNIDSPLLSWLEEKLSVSAKIAKDRKSIARILKLNLEDMCRKQRGKKCCP
jgi:ArsR family transcriptional regulator, arsenate/arsenite/antimonite-responsive transcriptional repressor